MIYFNLIYCFIPNLTITIISTYNTNLFGFNPITYIFFENYLIWIPHSKNEPKENFLLIKPNLVKFLSYFYQLIKKLLKEFLIFDYSKSLFILSDLLNAQLIFFLSLLLNHLVNFLP